MSSNCSCHPETLKSESNRCFSAPVTLKFDGWPWITIGHLFCPTSSSVHYFIAIYEFKLMLQSWNTQFGSKSAIFQPVWPRNLTDEHEKNRAPFLCYCKLCALFIAFCVFKLELQSGNAKFESKLSIFLILTWDVLLSYTACKLTHDFSDFLYHKWFNAHSVDRSILV